MSKRAKDAALKAYPVKESYNDYYEDYEDVNIVERVSFQEGYEQAEKDLTNAAAFSSGLDGFFYGKGYHQGKKDAEKHLGWHSVEESLPEETEYVTDNGCHQKWSKSVFAITTGNSVMVCWTKDGEFFCDKDFHFPVKVKYWMLMPKIPKEEK